MLFARARDRVAFFTDLKNDFKTTVVEQHNEIQALKAQLKEQAAQIQKVSTQLELSKAAVQMVGNNQ